VAVHLQLPFFGAWHPSSARAEPLTPRTPALAADPPPCAPAHKCLRPSEKELAKRRCVCCNRQARPLAKTCLSICSSYSSQARQFARETISGNGKRIQQLTSVHVFICEHVPGQHLAVCGQPTPQQAATCKRPIVPLRRGNLGFWLLRVLCDMLGMRGFAARGSGGTRGLTRAPITPAWPR
jgi:hypothetical protein